MISITEALAKVISNTTRLTSTKKELINSLNYFLAEDIYSPINLPPFNQSAMDGYAIGNNGKSFKTIGEIKAGDTKKHHLSEGKAFRIFTGAMVPDNTYAIAKQEIVDVDGKTITLTQNVSHKTSIRFCGEELKKGDIVLKKGTKINVAAIGLLSGLGIQEVLVYKKPIITIVITGNELTKAGEELIAGKIYESNSSMLVAALKNYGFESKLVFVDDNYIRTKNTINKAINNSDMVIMTGGISVGDYDFVGKALTDLTVKKVFYKVNQKPGKPLYFGKHNRTIIFALPGNPAAVLTCFYIYVFTSLNIMIGNQQPKLKSIKTTITHNYSKKGNREHLLKAQLNNGSVNVHLGQSSAMLSSFVTANCLLYLNAETNHIKKGDIVTTYLIP